MKICIVKPDGSTAEILLREKQPALERVNNELLFFENYMYKLIVREDSSIDHLEIYIGDYAVPTFYNAATDCYETSKELVFNGCFDLACISVNYETSDGTDETVYSEYIRIATTKQTSKQVEQMLSEIESSLPNFLEICFSRNLKRAGLANNDIRSIWNTLKIIDEIIKVYENCYGYFSNYKKSTVEQAATIVDAKEMRRIDQDSLRWIASNSDNLVYTKKNSGIKYKDNYYLPEKVKTYMPRYSYNVYENRVVLGFLHNVIRFIEEQIISIDKEMDELKNIPEKIILQIPNTHELTGRCVYIYYKGIISKFEERKEILRELYYKYARVLECNPEVVNMSPVLTNTFKQVYHYRLCYECMIKWFGAGDYSFDHLNYLFKLKTLSRIFEYYCLIKLQTAIIKSGYAFVSAKRIIYDIEVDYEDINNQYEFEGLGLKLTLMYEPTIRVDKISEGTNLYSTGYNFSKAIWNNKWTPDFVLKIDTGTQEYYYILDAKYSNISNVKKRYLPELVLKYGAQIASKDKNFSDVIGIGALYPDNNDSLIFFKKNQVQSQKQSLPSYFSLSIVGEIAGTEILQKRIQVLLNVIDLIELDLITEKDDSILINRVKKDNLETGSGETDYVKKKIEVDNSQKIISRNGTVNGKKCFYYGKGVCMVQKKTCTINDAHCDLYLQKNRGELSKDENSCRNFTIYMKKRKINRVECVISGLPGCVGKDKCQFYLKKNKK